MVKHIFMVLAMNVQLGALAAVTYSWSSSLANFSVSSCPGESVGIAGAATSYLSGADFRQTTCRNALLMEDGWKATLTYTVTVARDMSQFDIYIVPIQQTYQVGGFSYPISYLQPSPANLETICQGRKGLFSTSSGAKWLSVTCRKSAFFTDQYTYSFEDSYGFSWSFSATQSEAGLYFMVTTAGGSNQQIAYSVDTKVEWASGGGSGGGGTTTGPTNDNFSKSSTISGKSGSVTGSNVGATSQSGEPLLSSYSTAKTTVWWKWNAPVSGKVQIDTIGSSFDTQMGIYTGGSLSTLELVTKDDDGGGNATSKTTFACKAGTTYYICVGGFQGRTGTVKLNWKMLDDQPEYIGDFVIQGNVLKGYSGTGGDVTIPSSVTSIGGFVFSGCSGLTSVTIPSSVTSIGWCAFFGCSGLTSVTIPSSVTDIVGSAFTCCSNLEAVVFLGNPVSISDSAFTECPKLADSDGFVIVRDTLFGYYGNSDSVRIPEGVVNIGEGVFEDCSELISVTIPEGVVSIGGGAFGGGAFENCSELTSVTIPRSVYSIASSAFWDCNKLSTVYVNEGDVTRVKGLYDWPSGIEFAVASPITYANLHGATHGNPAMYQAGTVVTFTPPSGRTGYTFTGWTPAAITEDMTGAQTVTAGWRANTYRIAYYANGGLGTMADEPMTYDVEKALTTCAFTKTGYTFAGWATSADGAVKYANGAMVKNLATSGKVTLYAKWKTNYVVAINANGGGGTMAGRTFDLGHVYNLPKCTLTPPAGMSRFAGWACSNGRRYDDEMLVFDLGDVTITAIWE